MGSIMGEEIFEHSSACHKKSCEILWVPIMPGTQMLWDRDFFCIFEYTTTFCWVRFAGKMPASNILYNLLWVQGDERREWRIVNPVEKIWTQQGLNLWLQGERPAPKPLNHEDVLIYWGHHSSIWLNLLRLSSDWTCITPDVLSRRL